MSVVPHEQNTRGVQNGEKGRARTTSSRKGTKIVAILLAFAIGIGVGAAGDRYIHKIRRKKPIPVYQSSQTTPCVAPQPVQGVDTVPVETERNTGVTESDEDKQVVDLNMTPEVAPSPEEEPETELGNADLEAQVSQPAVTPIQTEEMMEVMDCFRSVLATHESQWSDPLIAWYTNYWNQSTHGSFTFEEELEYYYLQHCYYFLYDITGDNIPELVLQLADKDQNAKYEIYQYNEETGTADLLLTGDINPNYGEIGFAGLGSQHALLRLWNYRGSLNIYLITYSDGAASEIIIRQNVTGSYYQFDTPEKYMLNDDSGLIWSGNYPEHNDVILDNG